MSKKDLNYVLLLGSLIIPCIIQFILYIILFVLIKKTDNILPNKFKKLLYSIILLYFLIVINISIIVLTYFIINKINKINKILIFLFILLSIIITIIYIILFIIIFKYNNKSNNKNITAIKLISICTFINGIYQILLIIYNFSK